MAIQASGNPSAPFRPLVALLCGLVALLSTGARIGTPAAAAQTSLAIADSLPARLPALSLTDLLTGVPASFAYLFGTPGWPDQWSIWGLPPSRTTLLFNDVPFSYILTGTPAYDLVPLALIAPPRLESHRLDHPAAILTRMRPLVTAEPLTEGKYWKGGDGLESVDVLHAQHRRQSLFGRPGFLNVMGAYSGRGAHGEYPGSRLRRARQLHGRVRFEQPGWTLEILNAHNRRTIGAHGGVIPDGADFESIYRRTAANVENPEARRRTIRNDLAATLRVRWLGSDPSTLVAYWTSERYRYVSQADTVGAESDRLGLRSRIPLASTATHRLSLNVETWTDRMRPVGHFAVSRERAVLHAYARDSVRVGASSVLIEAGVHVYDGDVRPGGGAGLTFGVGGVELSGRLAVTGQASPLIAGTGFGTLAGLPGAPSPRLVLAHGEIRIPGDEIDVRAGAFFNRSVDPVDFYADGSDSAAVLQAGSSMDRAGVYADLGWRRGAARGIYATLLPSAVALLKADASTLHRRTADALPSFSGRGRLGARRLLFQSDLDLDVYVEALFWTSFRSRTLHAQSGLLVLPAVQGRLFGPSTMVNVVAEAGVRQARLFFVYENVLSGTTLMRGNLIVPVYPLPAQRFRFGVHWPIFN